MAAFLSACASSSRTDRELADLHKELAEMKAQLHACSGRSHVDGGASAAAVSTATDAGANTAGPWLGHYKNNPDYAGFLSEPVDSEWAMSEEASFKEAIQRHRSECNCESLKVECRSTACWLEVIRKKRAGTHAKDSGDYARELMTNGARLREWAQTLRSEANLEGGGWMGGRPEVLTDGRVRYRIGMMRPLTPDTVARLRTIWK